MKLISKISIIALLLLTPFFFSCEKEEHNDDDHNNMELCEICNSYCCEQASTPDCCCNF